MKNSRFLLILFIVLACDLSCQTLHVHSISAAREGTVGDVGYTLDGSMMSNSARLKLLEPANFGPAGIYKKAIEITDGYVNSGDLTQISSLSGDAVFFLGNFNELNTTFVPFSPAEVDALYNWSKTGGKVIIAAGQKWDAANFKSTALNAKWGFDWQFKNPSNFVATADGLITDLFTGPFGNVGSPKEAGSLQGFFSQVPANAKVLATEQTGNPTLVMDCNTLDLWVADIDAFTIAEFVLGGPGASFGPAMNNAQDRFWANTLVFMDKLQPPPVITNNQNNLSLTSVYNAYQWYRNNAAVSQANNSDYQITESGSYFVETVVNGGCRVRSNIITVKDDEDPDTSGQVVVPPPGVDECDVFLPSAFSPDDDEVNDRLCVYSYCATEFELKIFDRWGEQVFETKDRLICWDGKYKGVKLDNAVFAWTLNATLNTGTKITKKGNVTIVK